MPDNVMPYANLTNILLALQRFGEAQRTIQQAQGRNLDDFMLHQDAYALAFLAPDPEAMKKEVAWFSSTPAYEAFGLALASDTEGYAGHLGDARELTGRAVVSAVRADNRENAAIWQGSAALRNAAVGNAAEARRAAGNALTLAPASQGAQVTAVLALAMIGDVVRVPSLTEDLNKHFPLDSQVQTLWLPTIHAQLALDQGNSAAAINLLQAAAAMELGATNLSGNVSCLYPVYLRGQAYLAAGNGNAAASEFQKIIDHSGIVWNCWTGVLAHLGVARGNALLAKKSTGVDAEVARVRALAAYKDFLSFWKDADPDIPIYKQAKAEYEKLQ